MTNHRGHAIDAFLADVDEVLDEPDHPAPQATRVPAAEVPAGDVVWRIVRAQPRAHVEERISRRGDRFWFEGTVADHDIDGVVGESEVLILGPWDDVRDLVATIPDTLIVEAGDEVTVDALPRSVLVEYLSFDEPELRLPGDCWRISADVAVPESAEPIAAWDSGDHYGMPGGDRFYALYRFDDLYVAYDDVTYRLFGRHDDPADAIRAWIDWYLTDPPRPLDDIVASLAEGLDTDQPDHAVESVILDHLGIEPVCTIAGDDLYCPLQAAAWWDDDGHRLVTDELDDR